MLLKRRSAHWASLFKRRRNGSGRLRSAVLNSVLRCLNGGKPGALVAQYDFYMTILVRKISL
jgi:hypothetical protein